MSFDSLACEVEDHVGLTPDAEHVRSPMPAKPARTIRSSLALIIRLGVG
jgi:hypothetical protein